MAQQTDADRIETALNWVKQFPDFDIPKDLTPADATITAHMVINVDHSPLDPITWQELEWQVRLRGGWVVDLDTLGLPKDAPRQLHRR